MRIAIVGGTGRLGRGLAWRWARGGDAVTLCSRDAARARGVAEELSRRHGAVVEGQGPNEALFQAEVAVICVPYPAHREVLVPLAPLLKRQRLVLDATVPLCPPDIRRVHLPPGRAAALEAREVLGPDAKLVSALHHVSAAELAHDGPVETDVLLCSDHPDALALGVELIGRLGMRGVEAGPLENAVALEALTPVLLHINQRYRLRGAGIRVSGLP